MSLLLILLASALLADEKPVPPILPPALQIEIWKAAADSEGLARQIAQLELSRREAEAAKATAIEAAQKFCGEAFRLGQGAQRNFECQPSTKGTSR